MSNSQQHLDDWLAAQKADDLGVSPPTDLWAQIEPRLQAYSDTKPKTARSLQKVSWGLGTVAASLVAVAVFIGLHHSPASNPVTSEWYQLAQQLTEAQQRQVNALQMGYQLSGYTANQPQLEQELKDVRQARQELLMAMANNKGNAQFIDMLRWLNQQEIELLERVYQKQPLQQI